MDTILSFGHRASDSPLIDRVWQCRSEHAGQFLSVAATRFEIVLTRLRGATYVTLRGPETSAAPIDCPAEGEWLGIRFQPGVFMPRLPPGRFVDRRDVTMACGNGQSFWLDGSSWQFPSFENADTFVAQLARKGIVTDDAVVRRVLRGERPSCSDRSTQRHFLHATGLTQSALRQIEQARRATLLLRDGRSILDVVHDMGYFDQPHLTRSLKRLVGLTPAEIMRADRQLSFLYKTSLLSDV